MDTLDDILHRLNAMPEDVVAELRVKATQELATYKFLPNPGPQSQALLSSADVMLYGGQAGGGKSALLSGLALGHHKLSLLMRRKGVDLMGGGGLIDATLDMYGSRKGFNGGQPPTLRTENGRVVTFGSALNVGDEESYQGRARDFLGVDEAVQFALSQIRFLMGWVRSTEKGQRTRTMLASNPPINPTGDWIIGMFRPWLDITHSNPAKPGELRYYITDEKGDDIEVEDGFPIERDGQVYEPQSRTFIPAALNDNPYLRDSGYKSVLDSMPEPLRSAMRDGNFMLARGDQDSQIIPTDWIMQAQARWTPEQPDRPMTLLAVDVAQGGADNTIVQGLFDYWFDEPIFEPGSETPDGATVAGLIIGKRRNGCHVTVDGGGGYGGATIERLKENGIEPIVYMGSQATSERTADGLLGFSNTRTMAYWRIREALDPEQEGGARIALPPSPSLLSDLSAPTYSVMSNVIKAETKKDVVKKLGRSPDEGDAVVMAWYRAPRLESYGMKWRGYNEEHALRGKGKVNVVMSRPQMRRRRN